MGCKLQNTLYQSNRKKSYSNKTNEARSLHNGDQKSSLNSDSFYLNSGLSVGLVRNYKQIAAKALFMTLNYPPLCIDDQGLFAWQLVGEYTAPMSLDYNSDLFGTLGGKDYFFDPNIGSIGIWHNDTNTNNNNNSSSSSNNVMNVDNNINNNCNCAGYGYNHDNRAIIYNTRGYPFGYNNHFISGNNYYGYPPYNIQQGENSNFNNDDNSNPNQNQIKNFQSQQNNNNDNNNSNNDNKNNIFDTRDGSDEKFLGPDVKNSSGG